MMALSVYMRSGGPDKDDGPTTELDGAPLTLKQALDKAFDRSIVAQLKNRPNATAPWPASNGYWYYTDVGSSAALYPDYYRDSSTTQLVVAGLASARGAYLSTAFADPARAAQLDAATALARTAYERNGTPGGACTADPQPANEKGHGYNAGDPNSIQQTASGLWIQLVGGAGLNWPGTQSYLRWLQNRYRWDNISSAGVDAGWGSSYWYYLWSSFKAYQFLIDANTTPSAGNIGVGDIGMLDPTAAPACAVRQVHRDPSALPRIALFGTRDSGFYSAEAQRVYFDYAYTIMGYQCANGYYNCNGAPGRWDTYAEQAYALLVLQRSVGGGCLDADRDGICDPRPHVVEPPVRRRAAGCTAIGRPTAIPGSTIAISRPSSPCGRSGPPTGAADRGECLGGLQQGDSVISRADYDACKFVIRQQVAQEVLLIRSTGSRGPVTNDRRVTLRRHPPFFIIAPCPVTNSSPAWRCCCCRRLPIGRGGPAPRTRGYRLAGVMVAGDSYLGFLELPQGRAGAGPSRQHRRRRQGGRLRRRVAAHPLPGRRGRVALEGSGKPQTVAIDRIGRRRRATSRAMSSGARSTSATCTRAGGRRTQPRALPRTRSGGPAPDPERAVTQRFCAAA